MGNILKNLFVVETSEGWYPLEEFHSRNSKRPNVGLRGVDVVGNHLWRHPAGSSGEFLLTHLLLTTRLIYTCTEIGNIHMRVVIDEDVSRLDVSRNELSNRDN